MIKKILVIHTSFLGDAVLALPFIQELRAKETGAELHVLTSPRGKDIFSSSPSVSAVHVLEKSGKHRSLTATYFFAKELKKQNYTALYSLHRSFRSSLIARILGVEESYGFNNSSFSFVYRHKIEYKPDEHEVLRCLNFLQEARYKTDWKIRPVIDSSREKEASDLLLAVHKIKDEFIAIAPGSVWATKRYPEEHYAELIRKFAGAGRQVVLLGGKDEAELCERIYGVVGNSTEKIVNLCDSSGIIGVKEMLTHCALLITNDSALTHIGMAAGCPVLTLYCSTIPGFGFYPYSERSATEGISTDCKPCGIHGYRKCPKKHFRCGTELHPGTVFSKAMELLNA